MSETSALSVVNAFLDAFVARDCERMRSYLSDTQFSFVGPTRAFDNADDLAADLTRIGPILKRIERRSTLVQGNEVCVIFNFIATMPELDNTRVAQWFRVEDGKITAIELFYDAHPYHSMFEA